LRLESEVASKALGDYGNKTEHLKMKGFNRQGGAMKANKKKVGYHFFHQPQNFEQYL